MVLQKRLDYGFNGYQVPPTPRATRSARKRVPFRKKVVDNQMRAFDLLATVAGKLLLEGENAPSTTEMFTGTEKCAVEKDSVKKEQLVEHNPEKVKLFNEGSYGRNIFISEVYSQASVVKHSVKELSHVQTDACSGLTSVVTTSDSEKFGSTTKLLNCESNIEHGTSATKVDVGSSRFSLSFGSKLDDTNKNHIKIEPPVFGKEAISARADLCCSENLVVRDIKPPALASSDNSVKFPVKLSFLDEKPKKAFCTDHCPRGTFPACRDNVKLVNRDDDENSSGCTQPRTLNKVFGPPPRIGDRRIRRFLASKYWKVTPKLKDEERFSNGTETKSVYHNRVNCIKRQRSLRDYPLKKRRLYDHSLMATCDEGVSSDDTSSLLGKGCSGDSSGFGATMHEAIRASAFNAGQNKSFQPDSHVKLKIKSFKVPELFIEIPETATVGSLKRTVMEAVTAILGGGLGVGILLQGKKIRDDNKTLVQTGISNNNRSDALGFTLEPNSSHVSPPSCPEDNSFLLPCDTPSPLLRCAHSPNLVKQETSTVSPDLPIANFLNIIESDHDSAPSPPDMSIDKSLIDSRALVAAPEMNVEALNVVPMRKSKRLDVGQRRIRRPFSVSEVEALVQAVEKLGTGRWRDVKLRAFDNAKHRTYVDLKDKWKTLVHTARISPQQRRGEPVPQELLDRVIAAHGFWSQQQANQQLKHHSEACLLF